MVEQGRTTFAEPVLWEFARLPQFGFVAAKCSVLKLDNGRIWEPHRDVSPLVPGSVPGTIQDMPHTRADHWLGAATREGLERPKSTAMKKHEGMTKAELVQCITSMEQTAPTLDTVFDYERLLHELQVRQVELEAQSRALREAKILLEGSRDRYADLYDFAPVGYVTFNDKGIIHEINLTAAAMLEVERSQLVGRAFHSYVASEDRARFREHLGQLENPSERVTTELRLMRLDNSLLPVVMQSVLVYDAENKRHLCRAALLDITARKAAEETAFAATELNRGILGALAAHIAVVDPDGRIILVNEAWNLFAQENGDPTFASTGVGRNYREVCQKSGGAADADAKAALAGLDRVLGGLAASFQMEYPCHSSGVPCWFFMSVTPLATDCGGAVISHLNITERKQTELVLREREERLWLALDAAQLATWDWNIFTGHVVWNDAHYRMMGYEPDEVTPSYRAWCDRVHPEDLPATEARIQAAMEQGGDYAAEFRVLWPDGTICYLEALGRFARDAAGRAGRCYGVMRDITGRQRAETEISQLNESLEQRVRERTFELEAANESLRESEVRFRAIFEQAAVGVGLVETTTGQFIRVNQRYCTIAGRTPGQMLDTTFMAITYPDDLPADLQQMKRMQQGDISSYFMEKRLLRPDGSAVWVNLTVSAMWSTGELPNYHIAVVEDIAGRKRAEEEVRQFNQTLEQRVQERTAQLEAINAALQQSEARLAEAQTIAGVGSYELNVLTGAVYWSDETYRLWARDPSLGPVGLDAMLAALHREDRPRVRAALHRSMKTGVPLDEPTRVLWPDGTVRHLHAKAKAERDAQGRVARLLGTVQDITERKRTEEALRSSEERFRQVTETIDQVFWMTTVDKNEMLYISPAYERIWGRSCQSLYDSPRTWLEAIHPEDRPGLARATTTKQASGEYDVEYRIVRPDGSERWIHDRGFPVRDASGKVRRIAGVAEDITEAKRDELRRRLHYETARLLSISTSRAEVIPKLLQMVAETFRWDVAEFWEVSESADRLRLAQTWQAAGAKLATFVKHSRKLNFTVSEGLPGHVFQTRQPDWILDVAECPYFTRKAVAARAGLRSAVAFPIALDHEVMGMMVFLAHRVTEPDADLLEIFASVGSQIAQFIERKKTEEALREANEFGKQVIGGAQTGIVVHDRQGGIVVWNSFMEHITGRHAKEVVGRPALQTFPFLEEAHYRKMIGRALSGEVVEAPDIRFERPAGGTVGWMVARFAPWRDARQEIVGVIVAVRDITERKRLENEILAISEREQRKFGYDLHDGLGQRLTALEMLSHSLAEDLCGQPPALARQAVRLNHELRETVTQARLISHSLAPVPLEGDGLMRGLAELAASTSRLAGVTCRFRGEPPVLIQDVTTATHLYRIAQEAVNNALKHGQARKIDITLTEQADGVELRVENNGRAIPPAHAPNGGLGLNVMRYRAEMIGAILSIQPGFRKGACITCVLRKKI